MEGLFWRMEDVAGLLTACIVLGLAVEYGRLKTRPRHAGLLLAGGAFALLVGTLACAVWPEQDFFGTVCSRAAAPEKQVALTFDDGPDGRYTPEVLAVLREYDVPATFFLLGQNAARHPELVRRLAQEGHQLGNHTYHHMDLLKASRAEVDAEMDRTSELIRQAAGVSPTVFRPPHGFRDAAVVRAAAKRGMRVVDWSVMSWDWEPVSADSIVARTLEQVRPGAIILLHDGEGLNDKADRTQTVAALRRIIPALREQGYRFVTVEELLQRTEEKG